MLLCGGWTIHKVHMMTSEINHVSQKTSINSVASWTIHFKSIRWFNTFKHAACSFTLVLPIFEMNDKLKLSLGGTIFIRGILWNWKSQNPADVKDTLTGPFNDVQCQHFKVLWRVLLILFFHLWISFKIIWSYLNP